MPQGYDGGITMALLQPTDIAAIHAHARGKFRLTEPRALMLYLAITASWPPTGGSLRAMLVLKVTSPWASLGEIKRRAPFKDTLRQGCYLNIDL